MAALPLVRVRLKHVDVPTFLERFPPNVTRGGIFLASRDPRPVGALVRFEVTLINGQVVLAGEGRVTWVKPYNPGEPGRPHGMGVQFTELDQGNREMLERLLERREGASRRVSPAPPPRAERRSSEPVSSEFDTVEDTALRRALDRARVLASRTDPDEVQLLLHAEDEPAATLEQALGELPRFLARGRGTGLHRLPPELAHTPAANEASAAEPAPVSEKKDESS